MGYSAWEEGGLVFNPHYMLRKYAIAIVPISGALVSMATLASILEVSLAMKAGTFKHGKGMDTNEIQSIIAWLYE